MEFHPNEIKILRALKKKSMPKKIAEKTALELDAVMRTSSWLSTKKLLEIEENVYEEISLGEEGKLYVKKGLPERQLMEKCGKEISLEAAKKKVPRDVFQIALGWLRRKGIGEVSTGRIRILKREKTPDENLLELIAKKGSISSDDLDGKQKPALELLKGRKDVVRVSKRKSIYLVPTEKGIQLGRDIKEDKRISQLTPEIILSGKWKDMKFRPYKIDTYVSSQHPVKKHPLQRLIQRIRNIFIEMGFREISGPLIESAFWNFDALFQPQDHPARDMHDTFYLKGLSSEIQGFEELKSKVGKTHENGWLTKSRGWNYHWDENIARKRLLRTHTTAVTARHLSTLKRGDLPEKVFCIGKTFRNESVDYKHLPEFYQVEGIVVDESVTFSHLLGILNEFYQQMGFKVRFRPAYFPYTEPSLESEIFLEKKGEWIELGGAGIFRPEVVKPLLGFECPVLAWGLGLERLVALSLGLTDIREIYISDLDWLKRSVV